MKRKSKSSASPTAALTVRDKIRMANIAKGGYPESARDASLQSALSDLPSVLVTRGQMNAACDLIDAVSNANQVVPFDRPQAENPPYDGVIRDAEGLRLWVAEAPRVRGRVVAWLARMSETGRIAESMKSCGITLGVMCSLQWRHPAIAAVMSALRTAHGRQLVDRGQEVVSDFLGGKNKGLSLKASELALKFGDPARKTGAVDDDYKRAGVMIQINLDHAAPPPTMTPEELAKSAIVIPNR